ncbi:MAG: MFS transporter [Candidatus Rokubacteria bacterium]|nr:MFS transporter [Candidatus Rokubacteria bacterium]
MIGTPRRPSDVSLPERAAAGRLARLRWVMWAPPTLLYFAIVFERSTVAVIADRLMAEFQVGAGVVGLVTGIQLFTYLLMQVPCGTLADLLGPRRLLTIGACLAGTGTIGFGLAHTFGLALASRCVYSLGDSLVFLSVLRLQAEWFRPREYATLVGLTGFSGGLGAIAATAPLALLVDAFGWRAPIVASGVALALVAALVWSVVRDRPAELGLPSWPELEGGHAVVIAATGGGADPRPWRRLRENLRIVGRNPQTCYALLSHFSLFGPYLVFTTTWGIAYLMQARGLGRASAGASVALAAIGSLIGGPAVGWLSDRLGRRRGLILVSQGVMLVVWLGLMLPVTLPPLALDALIFGIGLATSANLLSFAAAKEANPPEMSGLATGFTNLGGFTGGALLPPLFGLVLDLGWAGRTSASAHVYPPSAYGLAFGLMLLATLIGMAGTLRLREHRRPA